MWDAFWVPFCEALGVLGGVLEVIWEPFGDLWEVFGRFFVFCVGKCETMKTIVLV